MSNHVTYLADPRPLLASRLADEFHLPSGWTPKIGDFPNQTALNHWFSRENLQETMVFLSKNIEVSSKLSLTPIPWLERRMVQTPHIGWTSARAQNSEGEGWLHHATADPTPTVHTVLETTIKTILWVTNGDKWWALESTRFKTYGSSKKLPSGLEIIQISKYSPKNDPKPTGTPISWIWGSDMCHLGHPSAAKWHPHHFWQPSVLAVQPPGSARSAGWISDPLNPWCWRHPSQKGLSRWNLTSLNHPKIQSMDGILMKSPWNRMTHRTAQPGSTWFYWRLPPSPSYAWHLVGLWVKPPQEEIAAAVWIPGSPDLDKWQQVDARPAPSPRPQGPTAHGSHGTCAIESSSWSFWNRISWYLKRLNVIRKLLAVEFWALKTTWINSARFIPLDTDWLAPRPESTSFAKRKVGFPCGIILIIVF